jgi:transposase
MHLGIDISKRYFDVTLRPDEGQKSHHQFANTQAGIQALLTWLERHDVRQLHVCLEATNTYWEAVADALHAAGYTVSVVNPARIKGFAMSQMRRNKNDKLDSEVIVEFCAKLTPDPWTPLSESERKLRSLARHREALLKTLTQQKNRLANAQDEEVRASLQRLIDSLQDEIAHLEQRLDQFLAADPQMQAAVALLCSIIGVGRQTARQVLAEMPALAHYPSASAAAADAGLTPTHHDSGDTVHRRPKLSKQGKTAVRRMLYWPAIVAIQRNPVVAALAHRLEQRHKPKMVIIAAAMRKLMHLIYGVLKNQTPFDPNYHPQPRPAT